MYKNNYITKELWESATNTGNFGNPVNYGESMENKVAVRFSKIWLSTKDPLALQANILGPLRKMFKEKNIFYFRC